jgi:endoglucanase
MNQIAAHEIVSVPGLGTTMAPGPTGFQPKGQTWILNPSYLPPPLLIRLAKVAGGGPWIQVLGSLEPILAHGSAGGFAMDWVSAGIDGIAPAAPPSAGGDSKEVLRPEASGSYDAIRVYLWLGIADPATPTVKECLSRVMGMANYMKGHGTPPEKVDAMGNVTAANGPPGFSAAIVPYLQALGMTGEANRQLYLLGSTKEASSGLYGKRAAYYDQNLALFATGWLEGRYRFDKEGQLQVRWK